MQETRRSGQVFSRVVMPIVLFLIVVAAAAYIIQNVHIFGPKPDDREDLAMQKMLQFDYLSAAWDPDNPDYLAEFESGQEGKFDYPFQNTTQTVVEAGLERSSCTCTTVKIALIPFGGANLDKDTWIDEQGKIQPRNEKNANKPDMPWIDLKHADGKSESPSIVVPVGGKGVVRLGWKGNDADSLGSKKDLSAKIWIQPKGLEQSKKPQELTVSVRIVPKVIFLENTVDVGPVSDSVEKEVLCWSATRDISSLQVDEKNLLPGFRFGVVPLSKEDVKKFQKEQLDDAKPRIQSKAVSAAKIKVRVEAAKLPFDGPFTSVRIPLLLDGQSYPFSPAVSGLIVPSIAIDGCPGGKLQLSMSREFFWIKVDPNKTMLTVVHSPINLPVSLERGSDEGKPRWKLKIVVSENTVNFPADSMIVIRSQPAENYRADAMSLASTLGNLGETSGMLPAGALPIVGDLGGMAETWRRRGLETWGTWGQDVKLTRVPVLKPY